MYTLFNILHAHGSLQKEIEGQKETKNNKLWECDGKKGLGLGTVNCGTVTRKYTGKTNGRQGLF